MYNLADVNYLIGLYYMVILDNYARLYFSDLDYLVIMNSQKIFGFFGVINLVHFFQKTSHMNKIMSQFYPGDLLSH